MNSLNFKAGLNLIDIILAIPLLWAAYRGFTKGLIIEVASLVALILAIYGSIHFTGFTMHFLSLFQLPASNFQLLTKYLHIISFAITFLVIVVVVYLIAHLMEKLVNIVSLTFLNKLGGALFSILKIAFILSVILYFINTIDSKKTLIPEAKRRASVLYNPISSLVPTFIPQIKNIHFLGLNSKTN